jgi:hypothetical protein
MSSSDFSTADSLCAVSVGDPLRLRLSGGELGREMSTRELLLLALLPAWFRVLAVGLLPFFKALLLVAAVRSSDCVCTVPARARPAPKLWSGGGLAAMLFLLKKAPRDSPNDGIFLSAFTGNS